MGLDVRGGLVRLSELELVGSVVDLVSQVDLAMRSKTFSFESKKSSYTNPLPGGQYVDGP